MIELPANFSTQVASSSTAFLAELSPLATLVIGILLASAVIVLLIRIFTR